MRLSVESYMLMKKVGDIPALDLIKEAGFDCVDFSFNNLDPDSPVIGCGYREYAEKIREHLDKIGLICNQAHAPFPFDFGGSLDETNPQYLVTIRSIESAAIMGAKSIVIHSVGIPPETNPTKEETWEYNLKFYRSFEPYAEKFGIQIAVENLFKRWPNKTTFMGRFSKPDELSALVRELGSKHFIACADIGHAVLTGNDPVEFVLGMDGEVLGALHIQDGDYVDDRHDLPYLGEFDWDGIMKALKKVGYCGDLTFEIFKYFKNIPADLIPYALKLAERVGRKLINIFDEA